MSKYPEPSSFQFLPCRLDALHQRTLVRETLCSPMRPVPCRPVAFSPAGRAAQDNRQPLCTQQGRRNRTFAQRYFPLRCTAAYAENDVTPSVLAAQRFTLDGVAVRVQPPAQFGNHGHRLEQQQMVTFGRSTVRQSKISAMVWPPMPAIVTVSHSSRPHGLQSAQAAETGIHYALSHCAPHAPAVPNGYPSR